MMDLFFSMIRLVLSEKLQKRVCTIQSTTLLYIAVMPSVEPMTPNSKCPSSERHFGSRSVAVFETTQYYLFNLRPLSTSVNAAFHRVGYWFVHSYDDQTLRLYKTECHVTANHLPPGCVSAVVWCDDGRYATKYL